MSYFAQIDSNNKVTRVIAAEQDFINSGYVGDPSKWIQTSYNTFGGVHYGADGKPDGGVALRGNFAGVGHIYDPVLDAFIPPKKFKSWVLDTTIFQYKPPIAMPTDGKKYLWDEKNVGWTSFTTIGDASYTAVMTNNSLAVQAS